MPALHSYGSATNASDLTAVSATSGAAATSSATTTTIIRTTTTAMSFTSAYTIVFPKPTHDRWRSESSVKNPSTASTPYFRWAVPGYSAWQFDGPELSETVGDAKNVGGDANGITLDRGVDVGNDGVGFGRVGGGEGAAEMEGEDEESR